VPEMEPELYGIKNKKRKKEKRKREDPEMHPDTPRSSRSLLLEALLSVEHHVEFESGRCDIEERGVVSGIWVFARASDD
jgi:hypothetical protein